MIASLAALTALPACSSLRGGGGSGGSSSIFSDYNENVFSASFTTKAYTYDDDNTADIFLTDLTDEELTAFFAPNADWSTFSGTLVQVHLFLDPKPGKTPIEPTAASASIRYTIFSQGEIGIYDGAGFMLLGNKVGKDSVGGTIRSAPLRLTRSTANFADLFGIAKIDLEFGVDLNDPVASELRARIDAAAAKTKPVRD
jgi:hypothetical protein